MKRLVVIEISDEQGEEIVKALSDKSLTTISSTKVDVVLAFKRHTRSVPVEDLR